MAQIEAGAKAAEERAAREAAVEAVEERAGTIEGFLEATATREYVDAKAISTPPIAGGWSENLAVVFRRNSAGLVVAEGRLNVSGSGKSGGDRICTLPAGWRPPKSVAWVCVQFAAAGGWPRQG